MKIEVGKIYESQEDRNGIATGALVCVGKVENDVVTFWKDKSRVHFNYSTELFEIVFYPYVQELIELEEEK